MVILHAAVPWLRMYLEPGVDTEDIPRGWPSVTRGDELFAFGLCELPTRVSNIRGHITYVRDPPTCSPVKNTPDDKVNLVDSSVRVNVTMAAHYNHTKTPEVKIQPHDNPGGTPEGVQYSATVHDVSKTMVWTGYMRTQAVPTHLLGALTIV
jgi:hypothetical protein